MYILRVRRKAWGVLYRWQIYGSQSIVFLLLPSVNSGVFYVGYTSQWRSQYFHRLSNYSLGLLNLWYFVLGSTYPPVADRGGLLPFISSYNDGLASVWGGGCLNSLTSDELGSFVEKLN